MHGVGSPDGLGGRLGEPEVTHLALLYELGHRPDRLLDGGVRVDPVLVVEVDDVDPEAAEAGLARLPHVLRTAVYAEEGAVGGPLVAELRGDHDFVAAVSQRPAQQLLVVADAVHVGGVEEVDAHVQGPMDHLGGAGVLRRAVEVAHAHAAQADRRDLRAVDTQSACLHDGERIGEREQG